MRIVVTGASGFIGCHFTKYLQETTNYTIIPTGRTFNEFNNLNNYYIADLMDFGECNTLTKRADYVFHFAAMTGGIGKVKTLQHSILRNNTIIDMNMLEASARNKVRTFFFASSACVYPNRVTDNYFVKPIKEEDAYPAEPDNAYGWGKLITEQACYHYSKDTKMKTRIARFFSIFGEGMKYKGSGAKSIMALMRKVSEVDPSSTMINTFKVPKIGVSYRKELTEIEKNRQVEMWGSGNRTRCFCHVDNIMEPMWKLANSDYPYPINIGSGEPISIIDLLLKIIKVSGKQLKIVPITEGVEKGVMGRNCDATKAYDILNWEPKISLDEGIERTYKWLNELT